MIAHQARNAIRYLVDVHGVKIYNKAQIKDMAVSYFQNLLGAVNAEVVPMSVEALRSLMVFRCSEGIKEVLIKIPSEEEIKSFFSLCRRVKLQGHMGFPRSSFGSLGV